VLALVQARDGRHRARLENRRPFTGFVDSNPALSAIPYCESMSLAVKSA